MESRKKSGLFRGRGFLSLSQEIMVRPRNLRDPNRFYFLLGVNPWASDHEIKSAYRGLSKQVHPDGSDPDEELFVLVNQAYRVLTEHREEYNNLPEGVRWRLEGEEAKEGDSVRIEFPKQEEPEDLSYYFTNGPNDDLAKEWYSSLQEELPKWGYRGRVALKLGEGIDVKGRRFEVPYESPTPASLFLVALGAASTRFDSLG